MTKLQKLKTLKTLLNDMVHLNWTEAKRKELIDAALRNGLDENTTWCVTKPSSKSRTTRGYYNIAEMIILIDVQIKKSIQRVAAKRSSQPIVITTER